MDARQVGFLAGRNIVGSDILNKFSKQMRNVRIGFLISAGLLMASTVVFFIEAQDSLDETITQYQKGSGVRAQPDFNKRIIGKQLNTH